MTEASVSFAGNLTDDPELRHVDDQAAVAYLARKRAEGKPRREALRCLERRPSNVSCKALLAGQTHHHPGLVTSPLTGRFDHKGPMA